MESSLLCNLEAARARFYSSDERSTRRLMVRFAHSYCMLRWRLPRLFSARSMPELL